MSSIIANELAFSWFMLRNEYEFSV